MRPFSLRFSLKPGNKSGIVSPTSPGWLIQFLYNNRLLEIREGANIMIQPRNWLQDFVVTDDDIDYLTNLLLEREVPMTSEELAEALIEQRIQEEATRVQERFKDAQPYDPAEDYQPGQRIVFPVFEYAIGEVMDVREGDNTEYGDFNVITVEFEDSVHNTDGPREFAAAFPEPHALNSNGEGSTLPAGESISAEEIAQSDEFDDIVYAVDNALHRDETLLNVAETWFLQDLMIEVNKGHMNLAEAVLDMFGGGPLTTPEVLENIGGIGENVPQELQIFSLNWGLNEDERFDEVGPAGEVLWFLQRMEPEQVQRTPEMLEYIPIEYDRNALSLDMLRLEEELGDEHSPLPAPPTDMEKARAVIIYPHRRVGTLPLNNQVERIFPTARKTERVAVTLVDAQDDEEFPAWVVRKDKYVHGLTPLYAKHAIPIGSTVRLWRGDEPGRIMIEFDSYKPRSEWVPIVNATNDQISFEMAQRAIGASYDDLLLLGVDDLEGVDALFQSNPTKQRPLAVILRTLIPLLAGISPQGHVHAKTLYSATNILRRCPPGPILATLRNNPDFENEAGQYWKLS